MRNYLLILLIIVSISALAQTDYRPGYYIDLNKDTIFGLLDYRGDMRNAKKCEFKKDANSDVLSFEPFAILSYRFTDSKYYISKTVKVGDQEMNVFVEFLVNGIADLFYFRDQDADHYFIENKDGKLVELSNQTNIIEIDGKTYLKNSDKYIRLLKATFADCKEIQEQIDKTKLTPESLTNLTIKYHDYVCDGEKCIVYTKKVPKVKFRFAPIIGVSVSTIKMNLFKNHFYELQNYDKSINPSFGILVNASMNKLNEKFSVQVSSELSKSYYYSSSLQTIDNSDDYFENHIHTTLLENSLGMQYSYPKGKLRPTVALGAMINYYFKNDSRILHENVVNFVVNSREISETPFPPFLLGGFAQVGCNYMMNNKSILFIKLKYSYTTTLLPDEKATVNLINFCFGVFL